jgi:hypothetical protein
MSKKLSLENLNVGRPCSENWDEMAGNERVRFCSHCSTHVNDLTAMGRKEARRLIRRSKGNICVRYVKNPYVQTPVPLISKPVKISRAPAIAAGVVGTTLGLSSFAYAQGGVQVSPSAEIAPPAAAERVEGDLDEDPRSLARFRGVVVDPAGAVVPGRDVLIRDRNGRETHSARTNAQGTFLFDKLSPGEYMLRVPDGDGFGEASRDEVRILPGGEAFEIIELPLQERFIVMGMVAFVSEVSLLSPLSQAVENNDEEEAVGMLAAGQDPNVREMDGRTPIFFAISNGNVDLVRALLLHGADVNARDENGETPLMQMNDDATEEMARILIDAGAKVNRTSRKGRTALMAAAEYSPPEVVKVLIDAGAEVNARDEEGWTPLMRASYDDDLEKVRLLLFAGAEVNLRNDDGENAWDQTSDPEIEDLLVSFGSEVDNDPDIPTVEDFIEDTL